MGSRYDNTGMMLILVKVSVLRAFHCLSTSTYQRSTGRAWKELFLLVDVHIELGARCDTSSVDCIPLKVG